MSEAEQPPYLRIAAEIAGRISAGELRAGDRVPSTRQITAEYGVAMATATKTLAALRQQGLVRAAPGVGTVVVGTVAPGIGDGPGDDHRSAVTRTPGRAGPAAGPQRSPDAQADATRTRIVRAAIGIADREGLTGLSMRRLAGELGVSTMSLYRHVADKEELVLHMMDEVFAANPPPHPVPDGWRARVLAVARLQWAMHRRHLWLAQAVSFTRPLLAPNAMAHTEWTMQALDGLGLDLNTNFVASVTIANHVRGTAIGLETEAQAEQDTGITDQEWMHRQQARFRAVLGSGRLPMMARYIAAPDREFDLEALMEFGLARLIDGLAPMLDGEPGVSQRHPSPRVGHPRNLGPGGTR